MGNIVLHTLLDIVLIMCSIQKDREKKKQQVFHHYLTILMILLRNYHPHEQGETLSSEPCNHLNMLNS